MFHVKHRTVWIFLSVYIIVIMYFLTWCKFEKVQISPVLGSVFFYLYIIINN